MISESVGEISLTLSALSGKLCFCMIHLLPCAECTIGMAEGGLLFAWALKLTNAIRCKLLQSELYTFKNREQCLQAWYVEVVLDDGSIKNGLVYKLQQSNHGISQIFLRLSIGRCQLVSMKNYWHFWSTKNVSHKHSLALFVSFFLYLNSGG